MANYIFDPAAHPTGTDLATLGWTERWKDRTGDSWLIAEVEAGLKVIQYTNPGGTQGRLGFSWDVIDSDAERADVEMLLVGRTLESTMASFRMLARASGGATTETGLTPGVSVTPNLTYNLDAYNGGTSIVNSGPHKNGTWWLTWVAVRARVNGSNTLMKIWMPADAANPTADEPAEWERSMSDNPVSGTGWVGLFQFYAGSHDIRALAFATGGDTATLSAPVSTPVAFSGSVVNQTGTEGTAFSLNLSTYFSGSETPFAYSVQSGTLPAGLSLNSSTGVISGTPTTAGVSSGIVIRATDATPNTADTNSFSITIDEAGAPADTEPPSLTGAVTFTNVTQSGYIPNWPTGSDNVGVIGYEYQIGGTAGTWTDAGNNLSAVITGRTPGATETVYVRAYDAAGLRSTPAISGSVTLESIPGAGINVTEPLKNNTGTVLASLSGVHVAVLQAADLVSVYETSGLTTNASGILSTISGAGITPGQQYHVVIKLADGGVGITGLVTAS